MEVAFQEGPRAESLATSGTNPSRLQTLTRDLFCFRSSCPWAPAPSINSNRNGTANPPAPRIRALGVHPPGDHDAASRLLKTTSRPACNARQSEHGRISSPKMMNLDKSPLVQKCQSERTSEPPLRAVRNGRTIDQFNTSEYLLDGSWADPLESATSCLFDTSSWRPFCDVTLTLKQARHSEKGAWIKVDDYPCKTSFSALHEQAQPSNIWSCIPSTRQTCSCVTRT